MSERHPSPPRLASPEALQMALCLRAARECTASRLRRAARTVGGAFDEAMASTGLRGTQFSVLVALSLFGEAPLARLADELGLDRTTMTRNLAPLERDDLVSSVPGPDRRVRLVALTPKGRRLLSRALPLWDQAQRRMIDGLGPRRWQDLVDGLDEAERAAAGSGDDRG